MQHICAFVEMNNRVIVLNQLSFMWLIPTAASVLAIKITNNTSVCHRGLRMS